MPIINPPIVLGSAGTYNVAGHDTDRTIDVDVTTLNELLNIVATLISDLKTAGILT